MTWVGLAAGTLAGGFARYFTAGFVYRIWGMDFPYGTLVVNAAGCFMIGIFEGLSETRLALSANARLLLITGFCGAFTTFSTFVLETFRLMQQGEIFKAAGNISASVAVGFLLFYVGVLLARAI